MIDWNKMKIRIDNGYVYLNGVNFESKIAEIHHYAGNPRTMAAYFSVLDINVATIDEGKSALTESLKNFILNLGIKTICGTPTERIIFNIKWIGESGMFVGYIDSFKIFIIYQIASQDRFYKAYGCIECGSVLCLDGYEKEIAKSIDKFLEKISGQCLDRKGGII